MKYSILMAVAFMTLSFAVLAEEEGGHEEKKAPPKAIAGSPVSEVLKLPVVQAWKKWMVTHNSHMSASVEYMSTVEGHSCWSVAVGDDVHVWHRFCVIPMGGDIFVKNTPKNPDEDAAYTPYADWVTKCKPSENFEGNC